MNLAYTLKSKGRHMPRQRFQRPDVRKMGTGRKQQWGCDYFVYVAEPSGKEKRVHKVARFGLCAKTKRQAAQEACDRFMLSVNSGAAFADASMTLAQWWEQVFKPVRGGRWARNTRIGYACTWRKHIEPHMGAVRLADINKLTIDRLLLKLADTGLGEQMVQRVCVMLHAMFEEAVDNDVLVKNPARKVELPKCKPPEETRSMTADEVWRLWNSTEGQDYLLFRVLVLCGARPNEAFALKRDDFMGAVLRIDQSGMHGAFESTKNKKTRYAPIPASLKAEIEEWLAGRPDSPDALMFTAPRGGMIAHDGRGRVILERAQAAAGIPDLTFRMCRTTFATLFNGDMKDAQDILGHHSAAFTLEHYRKPVSERAAAAIEEMDRRLGRVIEIPLRKGA
jgi:integrase